ncbi:terminase small subunit [Enterococcus italicus]|uniref:terminase small subunit n=1 Tax=Enterococcus italicus TaxID=246144 RepID=UPI0028AC3001|nr:terminase small subunit [Enterococcus italicus]
MARQRDPRRDEAFEVFKENNGKITNRKIAELLNVPEKTLSGWKSKDKWLQKLNGVLQTNERSTPKNKGSTSKKKTPKLVIENDELTEQQKLFCLYYLQFFNATKAYQKAYDCSYSTARTEGSRALANPNIKEELNRLKAELQQDVFLDAKDLMKEYMKQAFADITDFAEFGKKEVPVMGMFGPVTDENGRELMKEINYIDFKESSEVDGTLIKEVKVGKDGVSVKLYDKQKAMNELLKYLNGDELRNAQIMNLRAKARENDEPDEVEDDGFLAALESEGEELWPEE